MVRLGYWCHGHWNTILMPLSDCFELWYMSVSLGSFLRPIAHETGPWEITPASGMLHWPQEHHIGLCNTHQKLLSDVIKLWCMSVSLGSFLWPMGHVTSP